ncbi:hypothetical protein IRZ71_07890 [Flavobacterium sp. ANB]|uniref:hypothetical protein n=1 Tax=unclassified Flavobacterium TaxID=196869 RepID=UPI0012B6BB5F|nr:MULTISPECIES: hypothetical protein [unclassified Flavobacterium]MBF4516258.1 hypothetical protein [Flavobacterium sp. ANB]MTD69845.1 hypothetical protein [Flavobacterium sp. LC2016-13]
MKLYLINRISKVIGAAFLFCSCSSDLDFDQVNDLVLTPVFVANLAYFDVPANQFTDNGSAQQIASDIQPFKAFKEKFFKDNLVKAECDFELENTINRSFSLDVLFLNQNDQVLETLTFDIPAYSGGSNIIKYPTEVFENQRLVLLKQTVKIGFTVRIGAGPPLNSGSSGNLKLRSSATAYMEIEAE